MVRTELLGRFRSQWVAGALPMVVEHRSDAVETLCASPSLWMGGRLFAQELAERELGCGAALHFELPPGIRFAQALVGALRAGVAVDLRPAGSRKAGHRLGPDGLAVSAEPPAVAESTAWIAPDGSSLTRDELDSLVPRLAAHHHLREGLRVRVGAAGRDAEVSVAALLAPLWAGCEVHVLLDPGAHTSPVYADSPAELELGVQP